MSHYKALHLIHTCVLSRAAGFFIHWGLGQNNLLFYSTCNALIRDLIKVAYVRVKEKKTTFHTIYSSRYSGINRKNREIWKLQLVHFENFKHSCSTSKLIHSIHWSLGTTYQLIGHLKEVTIPQPFEIALLHLTTFVLYDGHQKRSNISSAHINLIVAHISSTKVYLLVQAIPVQAAILICTSQYSEAIVLLPALAQVSLPLNRWYHQWSVNWSSLI